MHLRNLILNYCKFCTVRKSIPNKILDRPFFPKTTQHMASKERASHIQGFGKNFEFILQVYSIFKFCFTWALEELLVHRPVKKQTQLD